MVTAKKTPAKAGRAAPSKLPPPPKLKPKARARPITSTPPKVSSTPPVVVSKPIPQAAPPEKADKPKKHKLVRDSFTIPKNEYAVLDELKQRAAKLGQPAKKSELLRAGVKALAAMSDVAFQACLGAVPAVKTGRPAKD